MARLIAFVVALFVAVLSFAQSPLAPDLSALRSKARLEGSVEVKVVTRAAANGLGPSRSRQTVEERREVQRVQDKVLITLIARRLIVGNEISVQPDGSFSMRVSPEGLERLVQNADVAEVHAVQRNQPGDLR